MNVMECAHCGAAHDEGRTCQDDFHTLLGWENEFPGYGEVHHLLVLCYHLQHPHLYSPEGLDHAKGLLIGFLEGGVTTEQVRREQRGRVSSTNRAWKVTARPGAQGAYARPVRWTMTIADIARAPHTNYRENVRRWANSILTDMRSSDNL